MANRIFANILTALLLASIFVSGVYAAEKPSVELFFKHGKIRDVDLSPSGKYLSVVMLGKDGRYVLAIAETANVAKITILVKNSDIDVTSATWITDDRIMFNISNLKSRDDLRSGETHAINRDGSLQTALRTRNGKGERGDPLNYEFVIHGSFNDDSTDLIVGKFSFKNTDDSAKSEKLYRFDTKKLVLTSLLSEKQPRDVTSWVLDKNDQPRFAYSVENLQRVVHYRAPGTEDWVEISRNDFYDVHAVSPSFIDDTGQVYVSKLSAEGYSGTYRYDPVSRKPVGEALLVAKGFDAEVTPRMEYKTHRLLGFQYETDARGTVWLDQEMKDIQTTIDSNMPGTINTFWCRGKNATQVCAGYSFSDQSPTSYWLYKPNSAELASLGATRPDVDPSKMAKVDFYRFKARDGLEIPVYVTMPNDGVKGPRPAVLLAHGGPNVRGGHWGWNPETQFLASRGYVVIEPEFRGSTGYGNKHFHAGWKKWGLEMQDDITDAVLWAISKGWVDKNRVAIAGASYGGYATLMGLIKTPELFRCGINWVGVSDLDLLYTVTWSDSTDLVKDVGDKLLIGDRDNPADVARFKATSPLANHEHLNKPLLMAYGTSDRRVPLVHGTKFRDAVMKHNPDVEWIAYDKEGHGWALEKNNYDWWTRVEAFLEKHMKPLP